MSNRQVRLASRPGGIPQAEHFAIVEVPEPEPDDGQILVRNRFLSVEPAMRGWVSTVANYAQPVGIGEVMRSFAAGDVIESRHPDFAPGDRVVGMFGWQTHAVVGSAAITRKVTEDDLPLSAALHVLGLTGLTAYFGLLDIGQPEEGDTVVVSTAAGSVGSFVGQIARTRNCRTVGITGGPEKAELCRTRFGYDAAIDYKSTPDLDAALGAAAPRGVNVYFDNTSGRISDVVLRHLAVGARVVICGTVSQPTWDPWPTGPRVERHLLVRRARMQGFVVLDFEHRFDEAIAQLAHWVRQDRLRYEEEILDGIEQAPDAIARLYRGENMGKLLVRV
ncbi:MAG TPA: NADP-dependent oxidoreductase [Acetobacteraceae bacterium]|nr:NADP-dependent oxidoreductase [Acetobacteraceae bacterium]